jgi:amidase
MTTRRDVLALGATGLAGLALPRAGRAEALRSPVEEVSAVALQEAMVAGRSTSVQLTKECLARIDALDRRGPGLRSVLETNPEALQIAGALDAERKAGKVRGPLHGLPVLLKDNVDTADRMESTAGSLALLGARRAKDAHLVKRLRDGGAVVLGKANLSEWANMRSTRSASGWSARGGQCLNPYALDRSPCGSSSGSAVAVAASLVPLAVGSETDGSIVCPASTTGIVGLKPTLGLVSRAGMIPLAHSQDTAGPMARSVRDVALLLGVMAGPDPDDPATAEAGAHLADYVSGLAGATLKGARIGVARKMAQLHPEVVARFDAALDAMRSAGAVVVDPADVPHAGEYDASELEVLLYELKADMNAYLAALPSSPARSLADLIAFNEKHAAEEMPFFRQELFLMAQEKGPLTTPAYLEALQKNRRLSREEGIDAVLRAERLDAIVAPTGGPAWMIDHLNGDHFTGGSSTPAAVAGYPAISVPMGLVRGLPVGISVFGAAWSDQRLLQLAHAFEQAAGLRQPPRFGEQTRSGLR